MKMIIINILTLIIVFLLYCWAILIALIIGEAPTVIELYKIAVTVTLLYGFGYLLYKKLGHKNEKVKKQIIIGVALHLLMPVLFGFLISLIKLF